MEKNVQVALMVTYNNGVFTYRLQSSEGLRNLVGRRVKVTFRSRLTTGVIISEDSPLASEKRVLKDVLDLIDDQPILTKEQLALVHFCAKYYFNPLGPTVHLAIPRNEKPSRSTSAKNEVLSKNVPALTDAQENAVAQIISHNARAFLLEGVTGSGKTHVYISVAHHTLKEGRSVLFLVPEISLTPQLVHRVEEALSIKALVMHSNITSSKKRDTLFALLNNDASLLIGARSALFAPLRRLGLIVVDEEHDTSLKQDETPRYHARDLALWRAKNEDARIILGSATPSLESIMNAKRGKLMHLYLRDRYNKTKNLPKVTIIDLKERYKDAHHRTQDSSASVGQKMCILSRPLVDEMKASLADGRQVLLFLNQRGYAKFGVCYQCGQMVLCPNCSVGLTFYQSRRALMCHQCKYAEIANNVCRHCQHDQVNFLGLGTERLEEEVRILFPDYITVRLDRDIIRSQRRLVNTLNAMHEKRAQILIGTQMIAKGHDFLHVGLVGVVCADTGLSMPDFRAGEKTFQLLTQVAGRAGRGDFSGHALIQTFNPDHPSIKFAKNHDVREFVQEELSIRKHFLKPPFSRAALVRCEHTDTNLCEDAISLVKTLLNKEPRLTILGPAPSPIEKINNRFRYQCLVMAKEISVLHGALERVQHDQHLASIVAKKRLRLIIDVDPQNMV